MTEKEKEKDPRGRPEKGRKRYNITLPPKLHARAKKEADKQDKTLSDLIEMALERILK